MKTDLMTRRLLRGACTALASLALCAFALAQDAAPANGDSNPGDSVKVSKRSRERKSAPDIVLTKLRERLEITDDAEWSVVSARITAVMDLWRSAGGGIGKSGFQPAGPGRSGTKTTATKAELDALREAVRDKMPTAEIKSRLDRLRVARRQSQSALEKAQEDLRAVLTVQQEAVVVLMGLLN